MLPGRAPESFFGPTNVKFPSLEKCFSEKTEFSEKWERSLK